MADDVEILSRARVGGVVDEKWTLERLLGVGGMAAVYAARHRNGARAAVKVLHPHLSRHDDVRERFLREGYAANQVEHPGAVKVLDDDVISDGADAGTAYLVMELLDGISLQERIERDAALSELEFLRIAGSVLDVLAAAHGHGVIHRDLKPENLFLVRRDGDAESRGGTPLVKVLDFGLARLLQGKAITTYGLALGTPSFMSPEQATGSVVDGRTDLFGLAATGFRVRTGRRIHEAANAIELVRKMGTLAAPRIRSVDADVSEPFARVIDRALEFRREDRYENAEAMRQDLERAIREIAAAAAASTWMAIPPPSSRLPSGVGDRDPTTIALERHDLEPPHALPSVPVVAPVRRRRSWPWTYVGLLLLAGGGATVAFDARSHRGAWSLAPSSRLSLEAGMGSWASPVAEEVTTAIPGERTVASDAGSRKTILDDAAAPAPAKAPRAPAPARTGPAVVRKLRFKSHSGTR